MPNPTDHSAAERYVDYTKLFDLFPAKMGPSDKQRITLKGLAVQIGKTPPKPCTIDLAYTPKHSNVTFESIVAYLKAWTDRDGTYESFCMTFLEEFQQATGAVSVDLDAKLRGPGGIIVTIQQSR